ncbi:VanZ family protein [Pseudoxanthomonas taiwanensis]|uniref:VanZ family protein n=1 Tax=Pseudoxanthomonas taiwanensis TaxID=176598 RepID=UPI0011BE67EF
MAVAVVCVASLTPPPPMELPRHGDKVEHLLAYAALAAAAVQVFRPGRALWAAGIGLVLMGVALEFAQGALTQTRMADPADALANTAGVLLGLGTRLTRWRDLLLRRGG